MSWQRPNRQAGREAGSRMSRPARLFLFVLTLGAGVPLEAQADYALIGQAAPDFALHAAVGGNVRLSEHRGEVVVLSFWGSGCPPCRTQLAALDRSRATYQSAGLAVYGIGVDDDPAKARAFAHSVAVGFELLLDPAKAVSRSYQVDNLPMTVLIDRNGTVRHVLRDYNGASERRYVQLLRALLNE